MTTQAIPPADLGLIAPAPTGHWASRVPPAQLFLTSPGQLPHQSVLLTTRWKFYDPRTSETYIFPINPDSMANPFKTKALVFGRNVRSDERFTTMEEAPRPVEWEFGGVIRTRAHHDALDEWTGRRRTIEITDHIGRTFTGTITAFEATERPPTKNVAWRLRYSMKVLVFGLPA